MKSAVVYLAHEGDADKLNDSIFLVRKNLTDRDIVVFYEEGDKTPSLVKHDNIRFELVKFTIPEHLSELDVDNPNHPAKIGYRHMCRFWSGGFFRHSVAQEYDYVLRLDCDSYITDTPHQDPIEYCEQNNVYYGYLSVMPDNPIFTHGLKDAVLKYCYITELSKQPILLYNNQFFYTNFEVMRLDKVWNPVYEDLFDCLDAAGGIYLFRWGDHVIRYLGINLSIPKRFVEKLAVPYQHQEFICTNQT